jgi:UDP-N-acetylmuramyl tripeptide synthase
VSGSGGSPGRFNLLDLEGASIVVDYGHDVPSLEQICATIRTLQAALNTSHSSDVTPSRSASSAGGQP